MVLKLKPPITSQDFEKVDIRIGKIVKVEDFPEARKPAYKLWINFGPEIGVKTSSVQFVKNHTKEELLGKQVACVINFPEKKVGPFVSQVLTLGPNDGTGDPSNWIILTPLKEVPLGNQVR